MNKLKFLSIVTASSLLFSVASIASPEKVSASTAQASLTSGGPTESHQQFTGQALKILTSDKGSTVAKSLNDNKALLLEYCDKPDSDENGYIFAYHFYNPYKKLNYLPSFLDASKVTALTKFQEHMKNAVINYNSNKNYSIQELGRALHYLEDINVPHHAANLIAGLSSHSSYESYVNDNDSLFFINTSNAYSKYSSYEFNAYCTAIFDECAKNAYSYKDLANTYTTSNWKTAATNTLKLGQEDMAALLYRFIQYVEK